MKAFTIWQPWASLIMIGAKPFEFRGWDYRERERGLVGQRIVIHAGVRPVKPAEVELLLAELGTPHDKTGMDVEKARELLLKVRAAHKYRLLPLGAGLGTALLGRPRNAGTIFTGISDSDRGEFNWAWPLSDIQFFDAPIEQKGAQGFWHWPHKEPMAPDHMMAG